MNIEWCCVTNITQLFLLPFILIHFPSIERYLDLQVIYIVQNMEFFKIKGFGHGSVVPSVERERK